MRIDASNHSLTALSGMHETARTQTAASFGASTDRVQLSPRPSDSDPIPSGVASMISANAGDALAAHSRLDPERALRLLGLLE